MKALILTFAIATMALTSIAAAHGGGCRKDSPQGMCCHMQHSTGTVHCH